MLRQTSERFRHVPEWFGDVPEEVRRVPEERGELPEDLSGVPEEVRQLTEQFGQELFHKRQRHNFRRAFAGCRFQNQFCSDLIRFAARVAERDVSQFRRVHRAGDAADFFAVEK